MSDEKLFRRENEEPEDVEAHAPKSIEPKLKNQEPKDEISEEPEVEAHAPKTVAPKTVAPKTV